METGEFSELTSPLSLIFRYRTRRRKTRYEPPLVVPSPDNKLADDVLYERDSGYSPPSSSYEAPSYNSYEEIKMIFSSNAKTAVFVALICLLS